MGFTLAGWHASETSVCGQSQRPPVNGEIDEGTFFSAPGPPFRRAHRPEPNGSRSASAKESQPRSCDQLRPSPVRATAPSRQVPCGGGKSRGVALDELSGEERGAWRARLERIDGPHSSQRNSCPPCPGKWAAIRTFLRMPTCMPVLPWLYTSVTFDA